MFIQPFTSWWLCNATSCYLGRDVSLCRGFHCHSILEITSHTCLSERKNTRPLKPVSKRKPAMQEFLCSTQKQGSMQVNLKSNVYNPNKNGNCAQLFVKLSNIKCGENLMNICTCAPKCTCTCRWRNKFGKLNRFLEGLQILLKGGCISCKST
jgi:hypothetical protein